MKPLYYFTSSIPCLYFIKKNILYQNEEIEQKYKINLLGLQNTEVIYLKKVTRQIHPKPIRARDLLTAWSYMGCPYIPSPYHTGIIAKFKIKANGKTKFVGVHKKFSTILISPPCNTEHEACEFIFQKRANVLISDELITNFNKIIKEEGLDLKLYKNIGNKKKIKMQKIIISKMKGKNVTEDTFKTTIYKFSGDNKINGAELLLNVSKINVGIYNLFTNNCDHFCNQFLETADSLALMNQVLVSKYFYYNQSKNPDRD